MRWRLPVSSVACWLMMLCSACTSGSGTRAGGRGTSTLNITGDVPALVVALDGPIYLPGPFAASSLSTLIARMRDAQDGRPLICAPTCWSNAKPPPRSLLIAVQYGQTACDGMTSVHAALKAPQSLLIEMGSANQCATNDRSARAARDALFAIPTSELPHGHRLTITVHGVEGYAARSTSFP